MKPTSRLRVAFAVWPVLALVLALPARPESAAHPLLPDIARSIRAHMDYLAGDALAGRGSGTPEEHMAADYVASELRRYGVAPALPQNAKDGRSGGPAGENGGYLQHVALEYRSLAAPPVLSFDTGGQTVRWSNGHEIAVTWLGEAAISGPLQKRDPHDATGEVRAGAVILLTSPANASAWRQAYELSQRGAALVLVPESPSLESAWAEAGRRSRNLPPRIKALPKETGIQEMSMVVVRAAAFKTLAALPDGTTVRLEGKLNPV